MNLEQAITKHRAKQDGYMESNTMFAKHFDHVKIERESFDGRSCINIGIVWKGVDRPATSSWSLQDTKAGMALALRFQRCLETARVHRTIELLTDCYGKTYISTSFQVLGRTLNADLKRMGF